jgi:DNA-directed RNA polymerase specialized sigma24 family protein
MIATRIGSAFRDQRILCFFTDLSCRRPEEVIALDDALEKLAAIDGRKARVVELRFFVGLSLEETAEVLKISPDSVVRDWRLARAWLFSELKKR